MRQLERYWKGFLVRGLDTIPEQRHELRGAVHDGLEFYGRAVTQIRVANGASKDEARTATSATLVDDACMAMVLLLGPDLAFSILECHPRHQTHGPQQLMRTVLNESRPILIACVLAATRREYDLLQQLLNTLQPDGQSIWEYHPRYTRHSTHLTIYIPKLNINDAEKPLAQALAACLTIAIAASDRPLFKLLHDYDLQESADGTFQHRFIGSMPFRDFKFHNWRNVQETALSCGEAEMFGVLVADCGWHLPWSVSASTEGRMTEKFGPLSQRNDSAGKVDGPGRLLQTRWWCCRRLS